MPRSFRNFLRHGRQDSPTGKSPAGRLASPTPRALKQSCWDLAAIKLQRDEPDMFEALQEMLKDQDPKNVDLQAKLSSAVQKHKDTMEQRQWTLPFKVRGRKVKLRGQLDGVLKALQVTKDFGSALAGLDPIHAGIPWAAANLIINGALSDSEQNKAALDGLSQILPIVARYAEIELIYIQTSDTALKQDFKECLTVLYASILKYQVSAGCHCQRKTFVRFLRSIPKLDAWTAMLQDIKTNDSACKEFTTIFDSQDRRIAQYELQNLMKYQEEKMLELSKNLDELVDDKKRQENARILRWICDIISGRDHQEILVYAKMGSDYKESGRWLLENPAFAKWKAVDGLEGSPFWLSGSVGTGKTSIVCRVIEWCIENARTETDGQVAYFYCSGKSGQSKARGTDPTAVLRSLVRQLAWAKDGQIALPVTDAYKSLNEERPQGSEFSLEECLALLNHLINALTDTTIIIDALDECSHPYKLLRALKNLRKDARGRIRLFVSGRNHVDVSSIMDDCKMTRIEQESTLDDIEFFLLKEVKHGERQLLRGSKPTLEDRLITTLSERAQGNFRWVELQLAVFMDENVPIRLPESLSDKLDDLDKQVGISDLAAVYNQIYWANIRASPRDKINAEKCYQIALASFEPFPCSEMAKAVALNDDGTFNPSIDGVYVQAICSNLLVLDSGGFFRLAHLSVTEFLESDSFGGIYSTEYTHSIIAEICLSYVINQKATTSSILALGGKTSKRFQGYANIYWPRHCQDTSSHLRQRGKLGQFLNELLSLDPLSSKFRRWLLYTKILGEGTRFENIYAEPPNPLFVICAYGFIELMDDEQIVSNRGLAELEVRSRSEFTLLMVAAMNGHASITEKLLRHGVDIQATSQGHASLSLSVKYNHVEVFDLLLNSVSSSQKQDALDDAVKHLRPYMVQRLLDEGSQINKITRFDETVLSTAIETQDTSMVQLLLNNTADAGLPYRGKTPFLMQCLKYDNNQIKSLILQHTPPVLLVSQDYDDASVLTKEMRPFGFDSLKLLVAESNLESVEKLRSAKSIEFAVLLRLLKNTDPSLYLRDLPLRRRKRDDTHLSLLRKLGSQSNNSFWVDIRHTHISRLRKLRGQSNTDEDLSCELLNKKTRLTRAKSTEW